MSKIATKTIGKIKILSIITAAIVVLGIIIAAIFGFNDSAMSDDRQLLTVGMNRITYKEEKAAIERVCEDVFADADVKYFEKSESLIESDKTSTTYLHGEVVYFFDTDVDLTAAKAAIEQAFETDKAAKGLTVNLNTRSVKANLPEGYVARNVIAGVVFMVAAFVYVSLRYKLDMGIATVAAMAVSGGLTVALAAFTRIPVTASFIYIVIFALIMAAVMTMLTMNKLRANSKMDSFKELTVEEGVASSLAEKETVLFAGAAAISLVLIGAIAVENVTWFALLSLISVVCSTFAALFFAPALYVVLKKAFDKKAEERARYDYKKGAKKEEKKDEQSA